MIGDDVKRQVKGSSVKADLLWHLSDGHDSPERLHALLKPCIVLTAEEAADVARAIQDPTWNPDDTRLLALLAPNQEADEVIPGYGSSI